MVLIKNDEAVFMKQLSHIIHQIKRVKSIVISKIKWMKKNQ
jgi:hypothetical protein